MNFIRFALLAITLGASISMTPVNARADYPSYILLRQSNNYHPHAIDPYGGNGYAVQTSSYAYGWFGVAPRRHYSRHFGYHNFYTEWTGR